MAASSSLWSLCVSSRLHRGVANIRTNHPIAVHAPRAVRRTAVVLFRPTHRLAAGRCPRRRRVVRNSESLRCPHRTAAVVIDMTVKSSLRGLSTRHEEVSQTTGLIAPECHLMMGVRRLRFSPASPFASTRLATAATRPRALLRDRVQPAPQRGRLHVLSRCGQGV